LLTSDYSFVQGILLQAITLYVHTLLTDNPPSKNTAV